MKSENVKQHYYGIDGIRTYAAISIVLMHIGANAGYVINNFVYNNVIAKAGSFVQLFFIVSAFGMCVGYYDKIKENRISIDEFYKKRIKKILPFFLLLVLIDWFMNWEGISSIYEGISNLTLLFGFLPNSNISVIGVGWALGVIFAFYWLFPAIVFGIYTKRRAWCTLIVSAFFYFACSNYFLVDGEVVRCNFLYWSFYFILGGIIYLYKETIIKITRSNIVVFGMITLVLTILYFIIPMQNSIYYLTSTSVVFSFWMAFAISFKSVMLANSFTKFVSGISLEIYLAHMMVFRASEKMHLLHITGYDLIDYLIVCVLVLLGSIIMAYVFQKLFKAICKSLKERMLIN